jgi:hypothetical protein
MLIIRQEGFQWLKTRIPSMHELEYQVHHFLSFTNAEPRRHAHVFRTVVMMALVLSVILPGLLATSIVGQTLYLLP